MSSFQQPTQPPPSLFGLVLAGGRSTRMHSDKSLLHYHGQTQRKHLYALLGNFCKRVFISCRQDQLDELSTPFNTIGDTSTNSGPLGAILSAFQFNPKTAWLVVACDLPLLSEATLRFLLEHRNPAKAATAFKNIKKGFPEPLITIWEPSCYALSHHFLNKGYHCPRKVLAHSEVELLDAPHPQELKNVNTPREYKKALQLLEVQKAFWMMSARFYLPLLYFPNLFDL